MSLAKVLIEIRELNKVFTVGELKVDALRDITLDIAGEGITALMGPSGSGKSSLLNILGALDTPTSGSVIVAGQGIGALNAVQRANFRNRFVGFVFQNFNLIPVFSALENVMLPAELADTVLDFDVADRAKELLTRVGLKDQMNFSTNRLSGGQMQRVAIARALMNKPALILADEPTANLDRKTAQIVLELMKELCNEERTGIVMATHDPAVLPYCQRVIAMQDGRVVDSGK